MVFSAFMMAAALAQAPVAPAPVNPASNQGRETVEQHLQCLTIVLLVGAAQKDQAKQAGMSGALGYYYGRIDALAPGTDIAANPNESVLATMDGTVILSTYTAETGYLIGVQHNQDLISIYKHCGSLLKKEGERVKGGEAIALVGNSGTLSTGPHLHFELWYKGHPINPEKYIVF